MARNEDDRDSQIFEARACGRSARDVAREFGLTVEAVDAIVSAKVDELHSGASLRESVGFALYRLERMELKYHSLAMQDNGDATAAVVALKANERRATLSGSNAPIGHSVRMIGDAAPEPETSTDFFRRTIAELRGRKAVPPPSENGESGEADEVTKP